MYINGYSMRITGGAERADGYVEMKHNRTYKIVLKNDLETKCDAKISIDGKEIGAFRLLPFTSTVIERPTNDFGLFTFYRLGSKKAKKAGLSAPNSMSGLITAEFTPEYNAAHVLYSTQPLREWSIMSPSDGVVSEPASYIYRATMSAGSFEAGGTGLSGKSNQNFLNAEEINKDYKRQVVINLRLICGKKSDVRPLITRSNKVPPAIY